MQARLRLQNRPTGAWRPTAALALAALVWWACGGPEEPQGRGPTDEAPLPRAFSVQLHVHGSFSEGLGSIDSQAHEATDLGLDALWWSDHDWRLSSYHTLSRFGFEAGAPVEQDRLGDWTLTGARFEPKFAPRFVLVARRSNAAGGVRHADERAWDGRWSYALEATGERRELEEDEAEPSSEEPLELVARLEAPMPGFGRPLAAGLSVSFALRTELAGGDRAWIEARLSEHPRAAAEGTDYAPHFVRYVLGEGPGEPRREGDVLWIPLEGRGLEDAADDWRRFTVPLSTDVAAGFPAVVAEDNALSGLSAGLTLDAGGRPAALFVDAVEIGAQRRGPEMFARQAEVIERVAERYPGLVQLQGVEVSYLHPHLNEFSVDTELLDYDALAEASGLLDANREVSEADLRAAFATGVVAAAHARGGLVSFNHFLGTDPEGRRQERPREEVLAELLEHRLYGADLLEVGYRDRGGHSLRSHLWAWDRLALDGGLRPVGVGVSDHHGGPERARTMANNFVTWIEAGGPTKAELIEGLRAGRAWFGDPARFDGALELSTARGQRMGQLVLSDRRSVELGVVVEGLAPGDRVLVIESGQLGRTLEVPADTATAFRVEQTIALPPEGGFVRIEAFGADDDARVFSNPIHFLRELPEGGLDPARGAFDVAGVRSVDLGGLALREARPVSGNGWRGLRLAGSGSGGTLVLQADLTEAGGPWPADFEVELKGLEGTVRRSPEGRSGELRVEGLTGSGRIVLRRPDEPR